MGTRIAELAEFASFLDELSGGLFVFRAVDLLRAHQHARDLLLHLEQLLVIFVDDGPPHRGQVEDVLTVVTDPLGVLDQAHQYQVVGNGRATVQACMGQHASPDFALVLIDPNVRGPDVLFHDRGRRSSQEAVRRRVKDVASVLEHLLEEAQDFVRAVRGLLDSF